MNYKNIGNLEPDETEDKRTVVYDIESDKKSQQPRCEAKCVFNA